MGHPTGLDELSDLLSRDWDVLDARANHVTICYGDDVCHSISRIDNGAREHALRLIGTNSRW